MKTHTILLLCLFISISASAQLSQTENNILSKEVTAQVNLLRKANNLNELKPNTVLKKAAKRQSVYMAKIQTLTHNQYEEQLTTPYKRVKYYKGYDFEIVGENVLQSAKIIPPFTKEKLTVLAKQMVQSWIESPPHYANMVNPDYVFADVARNKI